MDTESYNQPTIAPTAKVKAGAYAGIAATLVPALVLILNQFGVIVPDDVAQAIVNVIASIVMIYSALQTVVQFVAGYMKKSER